MNTLLDTIWYFCYITVELLVLFVGINMLVEIILMYIPADTIRRKLAKVGIFGNFLAAGFGVLTPFCACSTIPMTVGFLNAGVPFGATMSFVIASPLLNPIILAMLGAMVGWKAMLVYFAIAFVCSVIFGWVLEKIHAERWIKIKPKKSSCACSCSCGQDEEVFTPKKEPWGSKLKTAWNSSILNLKPVFWYLIIGVALGAVIYGYMPQDYVLKIAGPENPFAVPVAAVIGIPLYIRAETAIPIGVALMSKGMSIGAVIALVIGGSGMAIPEMSMLASIFKKKLVSIMVGVVFLTAVISGYLFNILL